jgi:conjugal transfer/entry exclusion protein
MKYTQEERQALYYHMRMDLVRDLETVESLIQRYEKYDYESSILEPMLQRLIELRNEIFKELSKSVNELAPESCQYIGADEAV